MRACMVHKVSGTQHAPETRCFQCALTSVSAALQEAVRHTSALQIDSAAFQLLRTVYFTCGWVSVSVCVFLCVCVCVCV